MSEKFIRLSNRCDLLSLSAHVFCCGIPAVATLLSLLSTISLTGSLAYTKLMHFAETWHSAAFAFSTLMVIIAVCSYLLARKRDCVAEGHCVHPPCAPKKKAGWRMLAVSLMLYAANVVVFLLG